MREIAIDTETTGLNKGRGLISDHHRIVELACIEMVDGNLTGRYFHTYIDPKMECDRAATKIHGIKNSFLKGKPEFKDIAKDFLKFISGADILMFHNAPFDVEFINKELKEAGLNRIEGYCGEVIDTLEIARDIFPGEDNTLDGLSKRIGVKRGRHSALFDAEALAYIWKKIIRLYL